MSSFYVTGGTLRVDAPSYVERRADHQLYQGLMASDFCYVLTSRQMGKSSLMVRTANRLRADGVRVVVLDLTAVGQNVTPEQWYYGLLLRTGEHLKLQTALDEYWESNTHLGPCQRFFSALRHVALNGASGPEVASEDGECKRLVVFVDEIDVVKSVTFSTDEFFAAIRECYNRRTEDLEFCRITFCLLGVAMPSELIRDTRLTPFNIGRRIELTDFMPDEAVTLAKGLKAGNGSESHASQLLSRALFWTGGHPYLTQRLCQSFSGQEGPRHDSVDSACSQLFFSPRATERDDNLTFVRDRLLRSDKDMVALLTLYDRVLRRKRVTDDETNALVSTLRLSGIVRSQDGLLQERNRIYERVFDRRWIEAHMPDAELRRQEAAYRQGLIRAGLSAAAVIIALSIMMIVTVKKSREARAASGRAFVEQADATRVSGMSGQRINSVAAIRQATGIFPDKQRLRNLLISSLQLIDLKGHPPLPGNPPGFPVSYDASFYLSARADEFGTITLARTEDGAEITRLPAFGYQVEALTFSPNGRYLAAKYSQNPHTNTIIWDWPNRAVVLALPAVVSGRAWSFSADDTTFAIGAADGTVDIYSLDKMRLLRTLALQLSTTSVKGPFKFDNTRNLSLQGKPEARVPLSLSLSPSGNRLAETSDGSIYVQVWDIQTGKSETYSHRGVVHDVAWHPGGDWLATACADGEIYVWAPGVTKFTLRGHEDEVTRVAFSPDGNLLASISPDNTLRLWVPWTQRQVVHNLSPNLGGASYTSPSHLATQQFTALQFKRDGSLLGLTTTANTLELWQVEAAREYRVLMAPPRFPNEIQSLEFSPDGHLLAAGTDRGIVLWDTASSRVAATISASITRSIAFDEATGDLFASGSFGLCRWPLRENVDTREIQLHFGPPQHLELPEELGRFALSPAKVGAVLHDDHIHLFGPNPSHYELVAASRQSAGPVAASQEPLNAKTVYDHIAISPDGHYIAVSSRDSGHIQLWDAVRRQQTTLLPTLTTAEYFCFSPAGDWFVTTSARSYQLWRMPDGTRADVIPRRSGATAPIAFSRKGRIFAVTSSPSAVELRLSNSGESLATLETPDRKVIRHLALSADGRWLAAAVMDSIILLWDLGMLGQRLAEFELEGKWPVLVENLSNPLPITVNVEAGNLKNDRPALLLELERRAVTLRNSPDLRGYRERGRIRLRELKDAKGALEDFEQALRLDSNDAETIALKAEADALVQLANATSYELNK